MRWPKMPPLNAEQHKLAADNFYLVLFVVRRLWRDNEYVSQMGDDAIGEGCLALVKAARAFDSTRGVKFSTYAHKTIYSNVVRAAQHWKKKTYTPDTEMMCRQYNARIVKDTVSMSKDQ